MTRETAKQVGLSIARRMEGLREIRKVLNPPSILIDPANAWVVWPRTYRQKVETVREIARRYQIKAPPVYPSPHDWPETGPSLELSIESQERLDRMASDPVWLRRLSRVQDRLLREMRLQADVEFTEQLIRLSQMTPMRRLP